MILRAGMLYRNKGLNAARYLSAAIVVGLDMKAVRIHEFGGPEVLRYEDVPMPQPDLGEIRIKVIAAGVNPVDWKIRGGAYRQFMPLTFPWTPGVEGAGIVETVGADVTTFKPGQPVFGNIVGGCEEDQEEEKNEIIEGLVHLGRLS